MNTEDVYSIFGSENILGTSDQIDKYKILLESNSIEVSCVGFDIYKYSKMENIAQSLIPFIIDQQLETTVNHLREHEHAFFSVKDFEFIDKYKVNTGDGFFIFFNNPFQSFLFVLYLTANMLQLNSKNAYTPLSQALNAINYRLALTTGKVYQFNDNIYGPAIINNARILSSDKLNRFIMDEKSFTWFLENTNGFETICLLNISQINDKILKDKTRKSYIFSESSSFKHKIKNIFSQKIDDVIVKNEVFQLYNIYVQAAFETRLSQIYLASVGNLNTNGINA